MEQNNPQTDKTQPSIAHRKAIILLKKRARGKTISFPDCRHVLSCLHFSREETNDFLEELKKEGLIEVVPFHWIRIGQK